MTTPLEHKIRTDIAAFLPGGMPEDFPLEGDLVGLGLDSLAMMKLAAIWRRQGHDVSFARLIEQPRLAAWLALMDGAAAAAESLPAPQAPDAEEGEPFPLALMQHAYWVGRDAGQQLGGVAAHFYHEFDAPAVEVPRLENAVRALLARHGMLRVKILDAGQQQILPAARWPGVKEYDLRGLEKYAAAERLEGLRAMLSHRHLDIGSGEVFDLRVSHKPDGLGGGCRLHVNLDMIAADAMSLRVLLDDLAALYLDPQTPLPPLDLSYRRYRQLREARLAEPAQRAAREADRAWWLARLDDLPGAPVLPAVGRVSQSDLQRTVRRHRTFTPGERERLARAARAHDLTLPMMFAAAFAETLAQFSDEEDFILNLPLFDREMLHPQVGALVGDFTSSVLLAWKGSRPGSFIERARRLQAQFREDAAHARFSGVEVLREISRRCGRRQLAPVVFTSALGLGELFSERVQQAFGSPGWIVSQGPQVWLDAQVTELNQGLLVNWDAREASFPAGILDLMFGHFIALLQSLMADDGAWLQPVPAALPEAQKIVREQANATDAPLPAGRLHDAFFRLADAAPDAPALLWETHSLSYGELARRARRLAAWLINRGVRPGDPVAIHLAKGPQQIVAVLAVLACGGAWLPLNHRQPRRRTDAILAGAGVTQVIDAIPDDSELPPPAEVYSGDNRQLAYIIYTSGSTGAPKGVEVSHLAAKNTIDCLNGLCVSGAAMRTLAVSALGFDLSVFDIFAPLSVGGAVVCIDDDGWRDARQWVALIRRHRVTVLNCVPAIAAMTATGAAADGATLPLRVLLLGGDWVPLDLADAVRAVAPGCRCLALGGTTETAIHSTLQAITTVPDDWRSVPYGYPLDNVRCRVVDAQGRDRCDWVSGELWIGGAGVALGYRGDPARTADRFVTYEGERWYRTGDMARYRPDGTLEFLGRRDRQIKVRGYRIELGEIEAALLAWPPASAGVALLAESGQLAAAVAVGDSGADLAALRQHLRETLPGEMVPEQLLLLPALPLSGNGKIDRAVLKAMLAADSADAVHEPAHPGVEQEVAALWQDLLGQAVGRRDNFFSRGGDSLLATKAVADLRRRGYGAVTLSQLFAHPQLADFCQILLPGGQAQAAGALTHDAAGRYAPFPLTDVQQAYLLGRERGFALGGIGCTFWREFSIPDLDTDRLEVAVNALVRRHDMLRAVFRDGQQRVLETVPDYRLPRFRQPGEDNIARQRAEYAAHTFSPDRWPLFSVSVAEQGGERRVGIAIDNLILDALSILQFYQELDALYRRQPLPAAPAIQFRDALLANRPTAAAEAAAWAWWHPRLPALPRAPQLPLAVAPEAISTPRFTRREALLDTGRWQRLVSRAQQHGVTPSAAVLGAFAATLRRWSAEGDFTLNLTLFDRPEGHPDIPQVMGDFTSLVLVPCRRASDGWQEEVRQLQREMWAALDHRAVSAVAVLRELARLHREPELVMPVVFTSALGLGERQADGRFDRAVSGLSQTPQVWLDHQVTGRDGGAALVWDAVEELFPAGLLDAMFGAYLQLLEHLCDAPWQEPLPDLLPAAQQRVREAITRKAQVPRRAKTLHADFFHQAAAAPRREALVWSGGSLSYGELAEQALRLGRWLQQRGARPGERIAVSLPKGPQQAVAVLGILAAGGCWVPVGADQPAARREAILRRADVRLLLDAGTPLLGPDAVQAASEPLEAPAACSPEQLAYIIFTSGSTGEPKGVEVCHAAADNTLQDLRGRLAMGPEDRLLGLSALDFDLSVFDLFATLGCGAALVAVDEADRRDAARWLQLIHDQRVTLWNSVPALLEMLLTAARETPLPTLRAALVSGDWIPLTLPARLRGPAPGCRFLALGGATEAAIWSNVYPLTDVDPAWRSIPYGYPLENQRWQVLNTVGEACPDWVEGELLIGGAGLADGYLGDPALTAARFPIIDGERWYRTGDRGRYWPDGTLEFLGRMDTQMKLRGHRIEAGEVEQALCALPDVEQAAVSLWRDGAALRLMAAVAPALPADGGAEDASGPDEAMPGEESATAGQILTELLGLPKRAGEGWTPESLRPDETGRRVLALWLRWLCDCGLLRAQGGAYVATAALAAPAAKNGLALEARARRDGWRAMLRGERPADALLADTTFAPASLSAADPQTGRWLDELAEHIAQRVRLGGEAVRVVELNGASGQHGLSLLARLPAGSVRYTLLESSPVALEQARARLKNGGEPVDVVLFGGLALPPNLHGCADIVFSANGLHRYGAPGEGLNAARQCLRAGGELWLLERQHLTPLAMISAGLLAGGFGHLQQHPLRPGPVWQRRAAQAGFTDIVCQRDGAAARLRMVNPRSIGLAADWKQRLAERLPAAMVPDRALLLTHLPLTANGKVDRRRLHALYDAMPQAAQQRADLTPAQAALAQIWAGLLGIDPAIGPQQSFFELGGDSLLATRLINGVREAFAVELPLRQIFNAPGLAAMSEAVEALRAAEADMEGGSL